jgi:hypothetical protein
MDISLVQAIFICYYTAKVKYTPPEAPKQKKGKQVVYGLNERYKDTPVKEKGSMRKREEPKPEEPKRQQPKRAKRTQNRDIKPTFLCGYREDGSPEYLPVRVASESDVKAFLDEQERIRGLLKRTEEELGDDSDGPESKPVVEAFLGVQKKHRGNLKLIEEDLEEDSAREFEQKKSTKFDMTDELSATED